MADPATITVISLLIVSIVTSISSNVLITVQLFGKMIKKSSCCGSVLEMRDNSPEGGYALAKKDESIDVSLINSLIKK